MINFDRLPKRSALNYEPPEDEILSEEPSPAIILSDENETQILHTAPDVTITESREEIVEPAIIVQESIIPDEPVDAIKSRNNVADTNKTSKSALMATASELNSPSSPSKGRSLGQRLRQVNASKNAGSTQQAVSTSKSYSKKVTNQ